MRERMREWLRGLLEYHPLLRLLVFDPWFRVAFVGFILLLFFLGLFLPKMWRVTPKDFSPVVKVSGLDLAQAWSLKRAALKAEAEKRFEDATYCWTAALANNIADADLARGSLRNLMQAEKSEKNAKIALNHGVWLLRLTDSSPGEMELAGEVFRRYQLNDVVLAIVEGRKEKLTPKMEALYLKTLFDSGAYQAFGERLELVKARLPADGELGLYQAAYTLGWGGPDGATEAKGRLEAAEKDRVLGIKSVHLHLRACAHRGELKEYKRLFGRLKKERWDTLSNHIAFWRLLIGSGMREEALALARGDAPLPATIAELIELSQFCRQERLEPRALKVFRDVKGRFETDANYWILYADVLIQAKEWEELREAALAIRTNGALHVRLAAFSHFLEARAYLGLDRTVAAEASLGQMQQWEFENPSLALHVASSLLPLGYGDLSRKTLEKFRKELAGDVTYWLVMFQAAHQLKDLDLMTEAAARSYALRPNDPATVSNYAAVLLIRRERLDEAIKLTFSLMQAQPNSVPFRINHGAALLLNGRASEAEALFSTVSTNRLRPEHLNLFHLDLFELHLKLRNYEKAQRLSELIEPQQLFPPQQAWFSKARQQLLAEKGESGRK